MTHRNAARIDKHCPTEFNIPNEVALCDCSPVLADCQASLIINIQYLFNILPYHDSPMTSGILVYPATTTQMHPKYLALY